MHPTRSLILRRDLSFKQVCERLAAAGWARRPIESAMGSIVPDEPELAQWRHDRDNTIATYTFNPAVDLRVLELHGLAAPDQASELARVLPVDTAETLAQRLSSDDERDVLRAIFAAGQLDAIELAGPIGLLAGHQLPIVAETAARVHLDLLHVQVAELMHGEYEERERELALHGALTAITGNAMPLLAALAEASADEVLGLQPMEEDCEAAFRGDLAQAVFEAYDRMWSEESMVLEPGDERSEIQAGACPAELLTSDNPFSFVFPVGYRALAPHLRPGRVWITWRYKRPDSDMGLAFDGLVHVRGQWVWFPKAHRVVAEILAARTH